MATTRMGTSRELDAKLAELQDLYEAGRDHDVIDLGDSILATPVPAPRRGEVSLFLAMANLRLRRIQVGEQRLNEAWTDLAVGGDPVLRAECMITQSQLAIMKQSPQAVGLAEDALAAVRTLKPVPSRVEVRALNALAGAHVRAGSWAAAISCYERAIECAGPLFDMRRQALMATEVAIAYRELGMVDRSVLYATRAVKLVETLGAPTTLAIAENNLGWILIGVGELGLARLHLERSMQLTEAANLESGRCHVLLSMCELNLAEGKFSEARSFAEEALVYAERCGESSSAAQAHVWLGRVAASLGEADVVDSEFALAIDWMKRNGESERLVRCHAYYAEILERRGEATRAYEHVKSAVSLLMPKSRRMAMRSASSLSG